MMLGILGIVSLIFLVWFGLWIAVLWITAFPDSLLTWALAILSTLGYVGLIFITIIAWKEIIYNG